MGNEMGNNSTSGFKEEENTKDEALGESLPDAVREDDTEVENQIILQNEAADIQNQSENPANSNATGTDNTLVDHTISGEKESIKVSTMVEASGNGNIENDAPDYQLAIQTSNFGSQNIMKPNAENDSPDVNSKLGAVPYATKANDDERKLESINTPLENLEPKVYADRKSNQLDPTFNCHDTSFPGEGAVESTNEGDEPSGETLSTDEHGYLVQTPESSNIIDSYVSDSTISFRDNTVEEPGQQECKTYSEDNYGSNVINTENMQESGPSVHIKDGSSLKTDTRMMISYESSSANTDQGKDNLILQIDHSEVIEDDKSAVGSNDGQGTTSDSLDVVGEESTGELLILSDFTSQLTETALHEQPCSANEVAVQFGDIVTHLEEETGLTVRKPFQNEGKEFQKGDDKPVGESCKVSLSVFGDAYELTKNGIDGDTEEMNGKEMAGDIPCESDKEYGVEEENGFLVSTSLYNEAFEEKTQNGNIQEEFLETKKAEKESALEDKTQAEKKVSKKDIDEKEEAGLISLSSAFPCSNNSVLDVKEVTLTQVKDIKACENGDGRKVLGIASANISKTKNVSPRKQKSPSFDFGLARTEESDQTPLLYKASVESTMQERGFSTLERCDSEKSKTPFFGYVMTEEKGGVGQEKDKDNNEGEWTNISTNDKSDSGKGKEKRKNRSFLFGNCMCCATEI